MVSRPHQITSKREPPRRLLRTSSSAFFSFSPVAFFFTDPSRENRHYISSLLIQRPLLTSITEFDKLNSQRSTRKHCRLYWSNWWLGTIRVKDRGLSMGGGEEWSRSYWEAFRLNSMELDRSSKLGLIHSIGIVLWRKENAVRSKCIVVSLCSQSLPLADAPKRKEEYQMRIRYHALLLRSNLKLSHLQALKSTLPNPLSVLFPTPLDILPNLDPSRTSYNSSTPPHSRSSSSQTDKLVASILLS